MCGVNGKMQNDWLVSFSFYKQSLRTEVAE
jgi:hypothetical protein